MVGEVVVNMKPIRVQVIRGEEVENRQGMLVEFQLNAPLKPDNVQEVVNRILCPIRERVGVGDVIILSGRGPIWLYASLISAVSQICGIIIATYDPKLNAGIIVHPFYMGGAIVEFENAEDSIQG